MPSTKRRKEEPKAPAAPPADIQLLTEIRDLLKKRKKKPSVCLRDEANGRFSLYAKKVLNPSGSVSSRNHPSKRVIVESLRKDLKFNRAFFSWGCFAFLSRFAVLLLLFAFGRDFFCDCPPCFDFYFFFITVSMPLITSAISFLAAFFRSIGGPSPSPSGRGVFLFRFQGNAQWKQNVAGLFSLTKVIASRRCWHGPYGRCT